MCGGSIMIAYQNIVELADQLPLVEKARLIEHLSAALRHELEGEAHRGISWHDFIEQTAGSLAATPLERPLQPPLDIRQPLE